MHPLRLLCACSQPPAVPGPPVVSVLISGASGTGLCAALLPPRSKYQSWNELAIQQ